MKYFMLCTVCITLILSASLAHAQLIPNRGMQAGNGNWMQIPDNASIAIPVFTVEVWVKSLSGGLIVTRDVTTGTPSDWQLWYDFSRKRLAFITAKSPPDSYFYTSDNSFLPDRWYHVALVVNGPAGRAKLYIDGNLTISPTFSSRSFSGTTGLAWCGYYNNASGAYLNGIIDEARYWNLERTEAQINATKDIDLTPADRTGLVGWWRFCDSYEDYSGMGNHGTPRGNPQLVLINLPFGITCNEAPCDSIDVTITGDNTICEGEESLLTALPGFASYLWTPTGDTTQTTVARTPGLYTVHVTDTAGCPGVGYFAVNVIAAPVADAGPDLLLCAGARGTIGKPPSDPSAVYSWTPADGLTTPDKSQTDVSTSVDRNYILRVENMNGCVSYDTVAVRIVAQPTLLLPDSLHLCPGSNAVIPLLVTQGLPPYEILWSPGTELSATDVLQPVVSPLISRWYHVVLRDSAGCEVRDSIYISLKGLELLLPDTLVVCANKPLTLPLQILNASGKPVVSWRPSIGMDDSTTRQPTVTVQQPTTYYVHVIDSLGCEDIDSIHVEVHPSTSIALDVDGSMTHCIGDTVLLTATPGYSSYMWHTPTRIIPDTGNTLRATQAGRYRVTIRDAYGCDATSASIFLKFQRGFTLDIDITGSIPLCEGDSVLLSTGGGFRNYRWIDDSGRLVSTSTALRTGRAGWYYVTAEDSSGCTGFSDSVDVVVNPGPNFSVTGPTLVCVNSVHDYSTLLDGNWRYTWTVNAGDAITSTTREALRVRWTTPGRMQLQLAVVDETTGCTDTLLYPVEVISGIDPQIYAGGPARICEGDSLLLRSVRDWPFTTWRDSSGQVVGNGRSCSVRKQGWYYLHAATADSCTGLDSMYVTVVASPDPQLAGRLHLCTGDTATYTLQKGTGSARWEFPSSARVIAQDSLQTTVQWTQSGTYTLQVTEVDSSGQLPCSGTALLEIVVHDPPDAALTVWPDTVICDADTAFLTATAGGVRYIWHTPWGDLDTTAHRLSGLQSGTYSVTVISAGGCETTSESRRITVLPLPDPEILGPITVCRNSLATYRLRPQPGINVRWQLGGGIARNNLTDDSLQVQWGENGAGLLVVTLDNGVCQSVDSLRVLIGDSIKPVISGPATLCPGSVLQLDAGYGYLEYTWSTPDGTASGREITVRTPGTYTVRVRDAAGCTGSSDPFSVQLHPAPEPGIQGPAELCPGDTATLFATPGYVSYQWSDGSSGQSCFVNGNADVQVTVVDSNGCEGSSEIHHVQLLAKPPDPSITREGMMLRSSPAESYQWYRNDSLLAAEIHQHCAITFAGTYTVTINDVNGCPASSSIFPVDCINGRVTIALPHHVVDPGDTVRIDLGMLQQHCLDAVSADRFTARIRFNKTLLVPVTESLATHIDGGDRIVELTSSLSRLRAGDTHFHAIATLGNTDSIPLVFDDMIWLDAPVSAAFIDGSLRMNICREGGERLYDAEGIARLSQNRPNPFNGTTVISYEIIERGTAELYILNTLGRRVATLFKGYREAGAYREVFESSGLPSGNYICILRTQNIVLHMVMSQLK